MKTIGITGGVGSGKTALLNAIKKEVNCRVFLADEIAHTLEEPGQSCYEPLVQLLGTDVLDERGFLDKSKMSRVVFKDKALLEQVNRIVHPAVKEAIRTGIEKARKEGGVDFCFVEAALFLEAGYRDLAEEVWYIYADEKARTDRLFAGRGYSLSKIKSIMAKQLQEEVFRRECQVVIDNSVSIAHAMEQVRAELNNK